MKTLQFKTNIKCSGCIAKVTPALNQAAGENNWKVNLESAEKILTVSSENINEEDIQKALEKSGYKGEALQN